MNICTAGTAVVLITIGSVGGCDDKMHAKLPTEADCRMLAAAMNASHDETQQEICVSEATARALGHAP